MKTILISCVAYVVLMLVAFTFASLLELPSDAVHFFLGWVGGACTYYLIQLYNDYREDKE